MKIDEWLDFLELSSFGVQFRYEEMDYCEEPIDRTAILKRVKQLIETVETAIKAIPNHE